jgi:thiol-disulfide isomerase/thioredoxin
MRRRRWAYAGVAGVVVAVAVVLIATANPMAGYSVSPTAWKLPALDGGPAVSLQSLRGKPVIVNFFASWCKVCAGELPVFAQDARALRGKIDVVEVNALETGNGAAFAQNYHLARSVDALLRDVGGTQGDGLYQNLGGTGSLPMTAFYDASGNLITTVVGGYNAATLSAAIQKYYQVKI